MEHWAQWCKYSCRGLAVAVLLQLLLLHSCQAWPWSRRKPDISSAAKCRAASGGHAYWGDSIYPPLQAFFRVNGPVLKLPQEVTDITTASTIIQLAVPELKLVLDPLLYLKAAPRTQGIPKMIHMTMKTKHELAPHQILSILSWGWFNKGYALLLYDNDDITAYMQQFYPGFMPTYTQLRTSVEKSDAWRYHVLCGHGGLYADTDTICAQPFPTWVDFNSTPEPGLIVGIENRFHSQHEAEEASYVHKIQVTQWTMASKRSHPVVCRMGAAIKAFVEKEAASGNAVEIEHGHDASILLRTGPGIWSKEVHSYLQQMGSSPEEVVEGGQVTDLVVLPQAAFGCNFRYWNEQNNISLVYHMFNNSWKQDHYKVADQKKLTRQALERAAAVKRIRRLYPVLFVLSAGCGVLLAMHTGFRATVRKQLESWGVWNGPGGRRRRRPHQLVATSSPLSSPQGSPLKGPSSSNNNSSGIIRSMQQRQSTQMLALGPRKVARLLQ